jgi:hypothetical protein
MKENVPTSAARLGSCPCAAATPGSACGGPWSGVSCARPAGRQAGGRESGVVKAVGRAASEPGEAVDTVQAARRGPSLFNAVAA